MQWCHALGQHHLALQALTHAASLRAKTCIATGDHDMTAMDHVKSACHQMALTACSHGTRHICSPKLKMTAPQRSMQPQVCDQTVLQHVKQRQGPPMETCICPVDRRSTARLPSMATAAPRAALVKEGPDPKAGAHASSTACGISPESLCAPWL